MVWLQNTFVAYTLPTWLWLHWGLTLGHMMSSCPSLGTGVASPVRHCLLSLLEIMSPAQTRLLMGVPCFFAWWLVAYAFCLDPMLFSWKPISCCEQEPSLQAYLWSVYHWHCFMDLCFVLFLSVVLGMEPGLSLCWVSALPLSYILSPWSLYFNSSLSWSSICNGRWWIWSSSA